MRFLKVVALGFWLLASSLTGQDNLQRRALLIGVSEYEKAGFSSLKYPEADVKGIEAELKKAGFKTTLMLSSFDKNNPLRATKANIERQLQTPAEFKEQQLNNSQLKPGFIAGLADLNKQDLVLVVLAGHGRQELIANPETKRKVATPFFCPVDANRTLSETWVSINKLMKNISELSGSEKNLILIDACRDNPSRGRGIDGKSVSIDVDNLAICFSSSAGTESFESDKLKHGIFSHFVIEGLKGEAANRRKQVTWGALTDYVRSMVAEQAPILVNREQNPHVAGSLKATPVLIPRVGSGILKTYESSSTGMEFVRIEAGSFQMGSDSESAGVEEQPVHRVTITKPFFIGKCEVTQKQWKSLMGTELWNQRGLGLLKAHKEGDDFPAVHIGWGEATEFCKKMSKRDGRTYRLPSEAEWEYACRGKTNSEFSFGDSQFSLGDYAWFAGNSDEGTRYAKEVGKKKQNAFGLYDMHGNVQEWCLDLYNVKNFYRDSPAEDPVNRENGSGHILRGGSWGSKPAECRAAARTMTFLNSEFSGESSIGFRVVCEIDK